MHYKFFHRLFTLRNVIVIGIITLIFTFFKLIRSVDFSSVGRNEELFQFVPVMHQQTHRPGPKKLYQDSRPPLTIPRITKYCNPPNGLLAGDEGLVPKDFVLLNVHVVIRHGDRSPISKLPDGKHTELSCLTDVSQFSHIPKVSNFVHVMASVTLDRPKDGTFKMWGLYPSHTVCADGQLTGQGAIQQVLNGLHLSERYRYRHGLFNETNWQHKVMAHSTEVSRTYQSAIAFLYGLLPKFDIENINLQHANNINFCDLRVVGTACHCQGIEEAHIKAGNECRSEKEYAEVLKRYKKLVARLSNTLGIEEKHLQWPTSLMDGLSSYSCHSIPLPCNASGTCLTSQDIEEVWEPVDHLSRCLNRNHKYISFAKVSMFGLLYRITSEFKKAAANVSSPTFHLYSGHDTTVSPLIAALELEDGLWPGYATRIVFELYRKQNTQEHFIRVLQNGKVVTSEVTFCKTQTLDGLCSFAHFLKYVDLTQFSHLCHSALSSFRPLGM